LLVWQRAHTLAVAINVTARAFPTALAPGLRSQLLRSSSAIPTNIAEGSNQHSDPQFARFISIAIGSANEVENHLTFARDIGLMAPADSFALLEQLCEIRRMLHGLRKRLQEGE